MRALVTGGAGFIGSHLVDALLTRGDEVVVLDDLSTGRRDNIQSSQSRPLHFVRGSVMDEDAVYDLMLDEPDVVFHLAAAVGVRLIVEEPVRTLTTNIRGTENVLAACAEYGTRVVIASTSEIYGRMGDDGRALAEDDQRVYGPTTARRWAYAESKAIDEFLALAYAYEHKLDVRVARLFNTVGPRQSGAYGMVLPRFVDAAVAGEPIQVFGDGSQTRCFCHVSDIVDGLVRLAEKPDPAYFVYNLGNPVNSIRIIDLAHLVSMIAGSPSQIVYKPYEEVYGVGIEDVQHRKPDIRRASEDLGWQPERFLSAIVCDAIRQEEQVAAR